MRIILRIVAYYTIIVDNLLSRPLESYVLEMHKYFSRNMIKDGEILPDHSITEQYIKDSLVFVLKEYLNGLKN